MPNTNPNSRLNLPANSRSRNATTQASSGVVGASGGANSEWLKPGMFIMKMPSSANPRSTSSAAMRSASASGASASTKLDGSAALTEAR
jgi:hypothetical protein